MGLLTMVRRPHPPLILGVLVAALFLTLETSVAPLLTTVTPVHSLNVIYLLGIVVVSSVWGIGLGLAMSMASTIAFDYFVVPPVWSVQLTNGEDLAILAVFMAVALVVWALSRWAKLLAVEYAARQEADLSAALARILLPAADLSAALPAAARRLAQSMELPSASIVPGTIDADDRHTAFALHGEGGPATLLVPADLARPVKRRIRAWVVPSLRVLLDAARERERFAGEQAALHRLAALVAHGAPPTEVFDTVAREMGQLLQARHAVVARYEPDRTATSVGTWNEGALEATMPLGSRWPLETGSVENSWRVRGRRAASTATSVAARSSARCTTGESSPPSAAPSWSATPCGAW